MGGLVGLRFFILRVRVLEGKCRCGCGCNVIVVRVGKVEVDIERRWA